MKIRQTLLSFALVSGLFQVASADVTPQAADPCTTTVPNAGEFTKVKSADGQACAGTLSGENVNAKDAINGDFVWFTKTGLTRIGGVPKQFVVLPEGVLAIYELGKTVELRFWSAKDSSSKVCTKAPIPLKQVIDGDVKFNMGSDFVMIQYEKISVSYFSDCRDNGKRAVFASLTPADRQVLEQFRIQADMSNNLTDPVVSATLPEILGRDEIVDKIIASVRSRSVRSTILWGPAGVGKSAIVERLATRIVRKEVPEWLQDWSVYAINIGKLSEGGSKGVSEQKMTSIVDASAGKKVILMMDELHQLVGLGTGKGDTTDVTEIMKTNLANGQLSVVGTTTDDKTEIARLRSKTAFWTRFNKIQIDDPKDDVLMLIYRHKAKNALKLNRVQFSDKMIEHMIKVTKQYVRSEHHPRLGIKIMEGLAEEMDMGRPDSDKLNPPVLEVELEELEHYIGVYANVLSLQKSKSGDKSFKDRALSWRKDVRDMFVGQDPAIESVANAIESFALGLHDKDRPAGTFLFLGPSGVGKTYLTELVADMLFEKKYQSWPMSQFTQDHNSSVFIGSPPGYVGYNPDGGELVQWINNNPTSVLNFDEIDKAHPKILDVFLNLLDTGYVKDASGTEAQFQNGYMFFTSNFGMGLINAYDKEVLGIKDPTENSYSEKYKGTIPKTEDDLKHGLMNMLLADGKFGEPFAGRIGEDRIIVFHHLTEAQARIISGLQVKSAVKNMKKRGIVVEYDAEVKELVQDQGFSFKFGARKAKEKARQYITTPVTKKMIDIKRADAVNGTTTKVKKYIVKVNKTVEHKKDKRGRPIVVEHYATYVDVELEI